MKVSIGMEKDIDIIEVWFINYTRIGQISTFRVFNYPLYSKVGNMRSFFNGEWVI